MRGQEGQTASRNEALGSEVYRLRGGITVVECAPGVGCGGRDAIRADLPVDNVAHSVPPAGPGQPHGPGPGGSCTRVSHRPFAAEQIVKRPRILSDRSTANKEIIAFNFSCLTIQYQFSDTFCKCPDLSSLEVPLIGTLICGIWFSLVAITTTASGSISLIIR